MNWRSDMNKKVKLIVGIVLALFITLVALITSNEAKGAVSIAARSAVMSRPSMPVAKVSTPTRQAVRSSVIVAPVAIHTNHKEKSCDKDKSKCKQKR